MNIQNLLLRKVFCNTFHDFLVIYSCINKHTHTHTHTHTSTVNLLTSGHFSGLLLFSLSSSLLFNLPIIVLTLYYKSLYHSIIIYTNGLEMFCVTFTSSFNSLIFSLFWVFSYMLRDNAHCASCFEIYYV